MIASSLPGGSLLRLKPAVQAAANAYRLVVEWRLELPPAASAETTAFLAWRQAFEAECRYQAWLPAARLVEEVNRAIEAHALQAEQSLVLAGAFLLSLAGRALGPRIYANPGDSAAYCVSHKSESMMDVKHRN